MYYLFVTIVCIPFLPKCPILIITKRYQKNKQSYRKLLKYQYHFLYQEIESELKKFIDNISIKKHAPEYLTTWDNVIEKLCNIFRLRRSGQARVLKWYTRTGAGAFKRVARYRRYTNFVFTPLSVSKRLQK